MIADHTRISHLMLFHGFCFCYFGVFSGLGSSAVECMNMNVNMNTSAAVACSCCRCCCRVLC